VKRVHRKRNAPKVKRKAKKAPKTAPCNEPEVKGGWDPKKTLAANYKLLGLALNPNKVPAKYTSVLVPPDELETAMSVEVEEAEKAVDSGKGEGESHKPVDDMKKRVSELQEAHRPPVLSESERNLVERLFKKFSLDFKSMARDTKINTYQHTAKQLKRKFALYEQLYARLVLA